MKIANFPFSITIEWMCFITSILLLRSIYPKYWKWFIPFLGITVGVESYSYILNRVLLIKTDTQWLYNIYLLLYLSFHCYIFYKITEMRFIKVMTLISLCCLIGCYLFDWYNLGFGVNFYHTNTIFNAVILLLSISYYYSLFQREESDDIMKVPAFWFVTGCLIFYATSTGVTALFAQIVHENTEATIQTRRMIMAVLNIIMYGCWIKSFLCLYKTQTSLQV